MMNKDRNKIMTSYTHLLCIIYTCILHVFVFYKDKVHFNEKHSTSEFWNLQLSRHKITQTSVLHNFSKKKFHNLLFSLLFPSFFYLFKTLCPYFGKNCKACQCNVEDTNQNLGLNIEKICIISGQCW